MHDSVVFIEQLQSVGVRNLCDQASIDSAWHEGVMFACIRAAVQPLPSATNHQTTSGGPHQMITFKVRQTGLREEGCINKTLKSLLETFDDVNSRPRLYLNQELHIPNVMTLRHNSDSGGYEHCIEIQPNNIDGYLNYLVAAPQILFKMETAFQINYRNFRSRNVETIIDVESAMGVLKYFHPNIVNQKARVLRKMIKDKKFEEFVKLVREAPIGDSDAEQRVHSLGASCATKIYEAFLNRNDLSPFQYLRYLKKAGCPDFLTQIRTSDGYNALHLAVKQESDDFMKMLFYANKWGFLRKDIVKPINVRRELRHVGYTPRRLAEALSFTDTGFQTLKIFDNYDRDIQSMPPLHKACLMGSIAFVSTMIEIRPYLMEEKDEYKANCLFYACASGSEKLVEYLLRKGVPRNVENIIGETPLHIAAMFGHLEVLNILSNHFFEIRGKLNKQGYNAMYYCSRFGDVDTLKHYKEKGFKIDAKALTIAAKYQQNEVFDFILRETDDVNQGRDEEGRLALHYVVINGNVQAVNELIQKKADITLTDQYNRNVFHLAAEYGQRGVMEILIDEAKKINNLEQLISTKDIFTGRKLSVVVRGKDRGRNAWHWLELKRLYVISFNRAMKSGRVDVARYGKILKSGFGTYADNECQEMMKKRLADIANEQRNDMTPLLVAVINDNTDLVKILLNNGASPDDQDYKGTTAMHYAAMNNNIYTMHLLSIAGGSLDVKTADGQTPYDIAKDTESSEAINFFCNARQPTQLAKVGER
ncbi:hypothetical protein LSH36_563g02078 [Paralvinella palmiformis]|uniref:Uncharacterized protein n=1 Tax=Paralvinella palmiformis TaxID=53620 RepID=A0AAD9J7D5_9ANNE|nr:hypothetical protein LSH36_563g02078 [Paralvinella palmiformis]